MLYASSKDALRKSLVGISSEIQGTDMSEVAHETGECLAQGDTACVGWVGEVFVLVERMHPDTASNLLRTLPYSPREGFAHDILNACCTGSIRAEPCTQDKERFDGGGIVIRARWNKSAHCTGCFAEEWSSLGK